jgi:hypothetical protein
MCNSVAAGKNAKPFKDQLFVRFLPGIVTCMVWFYIVLYNHPPCMQRQNLVYMRCEY